jgi:hypothetical protein
LNGGKRRAFLAKGVAKSVRTQSGRKKEDWRDFSKIECQIFLSKEIVSGHPVYHV